MFLRQLSARTVQPRAPGEMRVFPRRFRLLHDRNAKTAGLGTGARLVRPGNHCSGGFGRFDRRLRGAIGGFFNARPARTGLRQEVQRDHGQELEDQET